MAKPSTKKIKQSVNICQTTLEGKSREKFVFAIGKIIEQIDHMTSLTDVSMKMN